jgi:hypothetical protein
VETVVDVVATPSSESPSASLTTEQSTGIWPSASAWGTVADADGAEVVVRVVAALVVDPPPAGGLDVQPTRPPTAIQAATTTRRRIMERG